MQLIVDRMGALVLAMLVGVGPDRLDELEAARRWAGEHTEELLDLLMTDEELEADAAVGDINWRVIVSVMDEDGAEFKFALTKRLDWLKGHLVEPESTSLFEQAVMLKQENPDLTVDSIIGRLNVRKTETTGDQCPRLARVAREYERLRIPPVLAEGFFLHGTSYEMRMVSAYGQSAVELRTIGPLDVRETRGRQARAVLRWVVRTASVIRECSSG